jgi:biopolymer transport protein ExbB/TolQ
MNPWNAFGIGLFVGIAILIALQVLARRIEEDTEDAGEREE